MSLLPERPVPHRGTATLAVIGLVAGGLLGAMSPITFERVRGRGEEHVRLSLFFVVPLGQSAGPPGELDRALARTRLALGVLGGLAGGGLGALIGSARRQPPPAGRGVV